MKTPLTPDHIAETVAMLKAPDAPKVRGKAKIVHRRGPESGLTAKERLRMVYEQIATLALRLHAEGRDLEAQTANRCADVAERLQERPWREHETGHEKPTRRMA